MRARYFMWVVWPAFLLACLLELLVFALVDPASLSWNDEALDLSRERVYTLAFFAFWILSMGTSALTVLLAVRPRDDQSNPERALSRVLPD